MIRLAFETDFERDITTESELRICGLKEAYGIDVPFIQFYADDHGAIASIMDGVCVFHSAYAPNEEWLTFLRMYPDIRIIHTTGEIGARMSKEYGLPITSGSVMIMDKVKSVSALHRETPSLQRVYDLLSDTFSDISPFESWYVDVSHRIRHACCHIAVISENEKIISSAMTVAETKNAALIGCVATLPSYRGRGFASRCVSELLAVLPHEKVYIAPKNAIVAQIYSRLGFFVRDTWAEIAFI
jgi:GNAT superfamily N-acetyltransferase